MRKLIAVGIGGVVALGTAVVVAAPNAAASKVAQKAHFNAKTRYAISIDAKHSLSALSLRKRHLGKVGRPIGIATYTCSGKAPNPPRVHCHSVFSLEGGELLGPAVVDYNKQSVTGRITRGTGDFKGAKGTVSGMIVSQDHAIITVKYTD
jgi:hypothetical protein